MTRPRAPSLLDHLSRQEWRVFAAVIAVLGVNALLFLGDEITLSSLAFFALVLFTLLTFALIRPLARAARERALIQHGRRVQGRLIERHLGGRKKRARGKPHVASQPHIPIPHFTATVGYLDAQSQLHTHDITVSQHATIPLDPEPPLALYVDPENPDHFTAPALLGYPEAPDPPPVPDHRPLLDTRPTPHPAATSQPWSATLRPHHDPLPWGWWRLLHPRRAARPEPTTLHLDQHTLTLQSDTTHTTLDLSAPFSLHLAAWLDTPEQATLHVQLRPRDAPASAPSLAFSVRLPQARLDQRLPLQQRHTPLLDPERFDTLWETIRTHAALHGIDTHGVAASGPPALDTHRQEHQHEAQHVAQHTR